MFGKKKKHETEQIKETSNIEESECYSSAKDEARSQGFRNGLTAGLALALVLFVGVMAFSYVRNTGAFYAANSSKSSSASSAEISEEDESVVSKRSMSKLQSIEKLINQYYYLEEIDEPTLENGIYDGMITALGDRYADYYTEEELTELMQDNEGVYYGIGAYISIDQKTELPILSGIIEGTPAEEAKLRAGDIIYGVDGTSTYQMALDDVVSMVKGEENTTVTLTIIRDGDTFDVEVERRKVNRPTVTSEMLENDIGYIQITEFDDITVDQFTENYAMIKGSGAKALILDLRGNPGGLLSAVVSIGQKILPKGLIVYTEDKAGNREEYSSDGTQEIDIPLVVLVDGGSASASEILTGAVKDYGIGTIVGTTTYGKGIVQTIFSLSDGSAVKMTVSAYYTPDGNDIHGTGIAPDVEIPLDVEAYYAEERYDNQLEKAKEILLEEMQQE